MRVHKIKATYNAEQFTWDNLGKLVGWLLSCGMVSEVTDDDEYTPLLSFTGEYGGVSYEQQIRYGDWVVQEDGLWGVEAETFNAMYVVAQEEPKGD